MLLYGFHWFLHALIVCVCVCSSYETDHIHGHDTEEL